MAMPVALKDALRLAHIREGVRHRLRVHREHFLAIARDKGKRQHAKILLVFRQGIPGCDVFFPVAHAFVTHKLTVRRIHIRIKEEFFPRLERDCSVNQAEALKIVLVIREI